MAAFITSQRLIDYTLTVVLEFKNYFNFLLDLSFLSSGEMSSGNPGRIFRL